MRLSAERFAYWRIVFGVYLVFYYLRMAPFRLELWGRGGSIPARIAAAQSLLPAAVLEWDRPWMVSAFLWVALALALGFTAGLWRRIAALALFAIQCWCGNRNPLTLTPEAPFVHWLLLACALIPGGEPLALASKNQDWRIPTPLKAGAWFTLALGYAYSAQGKLTIQDNAWWDGTALYYLLNFDSSRNLWYGDLFLQVPRVLFRPFTWAAVVLELFGPLMILWRPARLFWLMGITLMHLLVIPFFNFQQLTFGMLMYHGFIFTFYGDRLLPSSTPAVNEAD